MRYRQIRSSIVELNTFLCSEPVYVKFQKLDDTIRVMKCTKNDTYIPVNKQPKITYETSIDGSEVVVKRKLSDEVERVFDLEKQEWRSFRIDSIIDYLSESEIHEKAKVFKSFSGLDVEKELTAVLLFELEKVETIKEVGF